MPTPARLKNAGGTPGGTAEFLLGIVLLAVGAWLLLGRVSVTGTAAYPPLAFGVSPLGFALLPVALGVGVLFFSARSKIGWGLVLVGGLAIVVLVVGQVRFYFQATNLLTLVGIIGCIGGGFGLLVRGLRPHQDKEGEDGED